MSQRLALYDWAQRYALDAAKTRELAALAALHDEPAVVARRFWPAVAVLAAALGGFAVILWIAANWQDLGRVLRFGLLQALLLALCAGAAWRPALRAPLALGAFFCIGGLFAYFGQTYQTGADPWQLFAVWALLGVPLAFGARSDVVWAPWALVVVVGISLWVHAHAGHRWQADPDTLPTHAAAWLAAGAVLVALSPVAARWTGAGPWSLRTAATLVVAMVTLSALGALFRSDVAVHYVLALVFFAVAAGVFAQGRWFDVFLLSAVALGLNVLLVTGFGRWLFAGSSSSDVLGRLLLLGLMAAGLLAASVAGIARLSRQEAARHG
jgi:uncharacterized membrane protein